VGNPTEALGPDDTDAKGTRLYVLNSGENSVGVYDITHASSPVFMSKLVLKDSGPAGAAGDFALNFSPEGNILYVVDQDIKPSAGGDYNLLHSLAVGTDGSLTEPGSVATAARSGLDCPVHP